MLTTVALAAAMLTGDPNLPVIPCNPGKILTYRGRVEWTVENSSRVRARTISWHTRFLRCADLPSGKLALVEGLPFDLAWYEPGKKPELYALIQNSRGLFIKRVNSGEVSNIEKLTPGADEQYLQFPVKDGACVGGPSGGEPGWNCWAVESIKMKARQPRITLMNRSAPAHEILEIRPGIGIAAYEYMHHGTVASAKVKLVRQRHQAP